MRRSLCLWGSAFFGLTFEIASQIRVNLFSILHQIVFYGKGGYDFFTVYNMPIWLRKFTYNEIQKHFKKEKEEYEKASNKDKSTLVSPDGKVNTPEFMKSSKPYKKQSSYK